MALDLDLILQVYDACDALVDPALISLVIPQKGGGTGQIFLQWSQGRPLKSYLKDPLLQGVWSLYQAAHCRIVDHTNVRRRLSHLPQPGDEFRFSPGSNSGAM